MDYSSLGSSAHGTLQARILAWITISSSRGSSWTRNEPGSPALQADSSPSELPCLHCESIPTNWWTLPSLLIFIFLIYFENQINSTFLGNLRDIIHYQLSLCHTFALQILFIFHVKMCTFLPPSFYFSHTPLPASGIHHFILCFYEFNFFLIAHISEIMQYLFFSVWLVSLNIMPCGFTHTVRDGRVSFYFKTE